MRELTPPLQNDPVPLMLKAMEMLYYFKPNRALLHMEINGVARQLMDNHTERAKFCAKIIARELSNVPLRWASGIYSALDPKVKQLVQEQLREFNPKAADILLKGSSSWLLTPTGLLRVILRSVLRILFGKEPEH